MTFTEWVNKTSMTSLEQLVGQFVWLVGSLVLTIAAYKCLTIGPADYMGKVPIAGDPKKLADTMSIYLAMADSYIKGTQSTGLIIAGSLLGAWVGGKGFDAFQHKTDRQTSKELINANSDAAVAANASMTRERPALKVEADHANVVQEVKG